MADYEQVACDALRSILLVRKKVLYFVDKRPDRENRNSKDIDFVLSCQGKPHVAVEHTSLESFEGQREIAAIHFAFVNEISKRLSLPQDTYFKLACPIEMYRHLPRKRRQLYETKIVQWITSSIHLLKPHGRMIQLPIENGKYILWLGRGGSHQNLNGRLLPSMVAPTNLDTERNQRIDRALNAKLPKLLPYQQKGFLTYLLLEDWDISLSNSQLVKNGVLKLKKKYSNILPYSIIQMTSYNDHIVEAWIVKENKKWASRIYKHGPLYEFKI
jgi:hypothetical protein